MADEVMPLKTVQPWLSSLNDVLCSQILQAINRGADAIPQLNAALARVSPKRCVAQAELPSGMAYEQFIYDTGTIPTRTLAGSNGAMHDACNALMWVHYPRSKAVLNALQAADIKAHGIQSRRGAVRDALTLLDESALILAYPAGDALPHQLANRHWLELLHTRRSDWLAGDDAQAARIQPYLFGHAVLQKLQAPYPAITAQVWLLPYQHLDEVVDIAAVDSLFAASLEVASQQGAITPQTLLPLPVLGIPAFWADNSLAQFYENIQVFRPLLRLNELHTRLHKSLK
jgi:hypothetical protein